jgi:hypothetical protein
MECQKFIALDDVRGVQGNTTKIPIEIVKKKHVKENHAPQTFNQQRESYFPAGRTLLNSLANRKTKVPTAVRGRVFLYARSQTKNYQKSVLTWLVDFGEFVQQLLAGGGRRRE